jgi:hypothetical protein
VGQAHDAAELLKPEHIEYHKWGQWVLSELSVEAD